MSKIYGIDCLCTPSPLLEHDYVLSIGVPHLIGMHLSYGGDVYIQNMEGPQCERVEQVDISTLSRLAAEYCEAYSRCCISIASHGDDDILRFSYSLSVTTIDNARHRYSVGYFSRPGDLSPSSIHKLRKGWLSLVYDMRALYGHVKVERSHREQLRNLHSAWDGPCRLEWVNWFSSDYAEIFNPESFQNDSFTRIDGESGPYWMIQLCERPGDFFTWTIHRKRRVLQAIIGKSCFSKMVSSEYDAFLMNMGYFKRRRAAKVPGIVRNSDLGQ